MEVTNKFKGLDVIDREPKRTMERGSWHCLGVIDQNHPQGKEMQEGKMVVWGGLINSWEKKRSKRQTRKGASLFSEN